MAMAAGADVVRLFTTDDPRRGGIRMLHGSAAGPRMALQVRRPGGGSWIIRGVRRDQPVHASMVGCATTDSRAWLRSRLQTLQRLEALGYPAPRVIASRAGEVIESAGDWWISAHTYIEGAPIRPTHDQLRQLGHALGRLHSLAWSPADPAARIGRSGWHPDAAIPATLDRLTAVGPLLPPEWRDVHADLTRSVQMISAHRTVLAETITHAGAWPANAIRTAPEEVTLIDWDTGGAGHALADLGRCLLECHLDTDAPADDPAAWHIRPNPARITALATGYRRERTPPATELELLDAGIQYGIAFVAAIHLTQALHDGVRGPHMDTRWNRIRNRLAASAEIATIAARAFTT
jgi:Ser/Thr protein kinase RdoA (MazF antagonist)